MSRMIPRISRAFSLKHSNRTVSVIMKRCASCEVEHTSVLFTSTSGFKGDNCNSNKPMPQNKTESNRVFCTF